MKTCSEQQKLLYDISMIDFAVVEMCLYLDTHPYEKEAIEYFNHYIKIKNDLTKDYAVKYGPLNLSVAGNNHSNEWKWALQPLPWEGVYK